MPLDGGREESGFLREFLRVVFAEVAVPVRGVVEEEDVFAGLSLETAMRRTCGGLEEGG